MSHSNTPKYVICHRYETANLKDEYKNSIYITVIIGCAVLRMRNVATFTCACGIWRGWGAGWFWVRWNDAVIIVT